MEPHKISDRNSLFRCRYCKKCIKGVDDFVRHKREYHEEEIHSRKIEKGVKKKGNLKRLSSLINQPRNTLEHSAETRLEKNGEPLASCAKNPGISSSATPPSTSQPVNEHQSLENDSNTWLLPAINNAIVKLERLEETETTGTSQDNSHLSKLHFMGSLNQLTEANPPQEFQTGEDEDDDLCVVAIYPSSKPNSISSRNLLANSLYKLGIRGPLIDEDGIEVVGFALPEASVFFKAPPASSSSSDLVDPLALDQPEPEPNTSAMEVENSQCSTDSAFAITFPNIVAVATGQNEHASAASLSLTSSTMSNEPGDIASRSPTTFPESNTKTTEIMEASYSICAKADAPSTEQNIVIDSVCTLSKSTVFSIPSTETMETPVSAPSSQSSLTSDSGISTNDSASEMDTDENSWCVNGVYPGKISFQKGNDELEGAPDFKKNTKACKIEIFTPAQTSRSKQFKFSPKINSEFSATPPHDSPSAPSTNIPLPKKDILPDHILQMKNEDDDRDSYEYKCELCGELIAKAENIEDHMRDVHESHLVYKCNMCNETFDQELALIWHSTIHFELICRICGGKFDGKYNLDVHMKREHGNLSTHLQDPESVFPTVPVTNDQSVPLKSSVSKTVRSSTGTSDNSGGVSSQSDTEKMTSDSRVPAMPQTVSIRTVSPVNTITSQMAPPLPEVQLPTAPPSTPLRLSPTPNSEATEADASNLRAQVNSAQSIRRISELEGEQLSRTAKPEMDGKYTCAICQSRLSSRQRLTNHIRLHTGANRFKCGYCPEIFKNSAKHKRHEWVVHSVDYLAKEPRTYSCKNCRETFSSRARAKAHRIQNACKNLARLRDEYCDKTFSHPSELSSHEEEHQLCNDSLAPSPQTPSDSSCSLPPEAFLEISIKDEMYPSPNPRQQAQDSSPESGTAPASETNCVSVIQFHRHQEPENQETVEQELHPEMQFKCSYCPMVFPGKVRRHIHESQHHQPQTTPSSPPTATLHAPPSRTTSTDPQNPHQSNATIHPITFYSSGTQSSPPTSEYSCNHCNKKFMDIKDLQVHETSHYVCRYCFQIFSDGIAWHKHLQMHTGHTLPESIIHSRQSQLTQEAAPSSRQPNLLAALAKENLNQCPQNSSQQDTQNQITAQFTFPANSNHGGQPKQFQCPHCPCNFNTSRTLNNHKRFHRDETKHKCNFCGRLFATRIACSHHENLHTGMRPYKCKFCTSAFPSPVHRWQHEKKNHRVTTAQVARREQFPESSPLPNPYCTFNIPTAPKPHQSPSHPIQKPQLSAIRAENAPNPHCAVCGEYNSALSPCKCRKHFEISNQPYRCTKSSAQFHTPVALELGKKVYPEATDAAYNIVQEPNLKENFPSACVSTAETFKSSKIYQCSECFQNFSDENLLQLHELISCEGSTNKCNICLITFTDLSSFKAHQSSHHQADSIPTEFQCNFCQTNFPKEFLRDLHEAVSHKQGKPSQVPASSTQSNVPPYYSLNNSANYTTANEQKSRENTNRNQERFNDTSQTFSISANPFNPSTFSNQSTGQTAQLNMFQPPSALPTPSLVTPSHFQQHHSSLVPNCPPPNSQQRPYTCRFCGRSFFNPNHLIFHELNTHGVRAPQQHLLRCKYCPQSFSILSQLYDHEYNNHSSLKIPTSCCYPKNAQRFYQPSAPSRFPTPTFPHPPFMSPNPATPSANNVPYLNTNFMQYTMTGASCRQQSTSLATGFGKPGEIFNQNYGPVPERPLHNNISKW